MRPIAPVRRPLVRQGQVIHVGVLPIPQEARVVQESTLHNALSVTADLAIADDVIVLPESEGRHGGVGDGGGGIIVIIARRSARMRRRMRRRRLRRSR